MNFLVNVDPRYYNTRGGSGPGFQNNRVGVGCSKVNQQMQDLPSMFVSFVTVLAHCC